MTHTQRTIVIGDLHGCRVTFERLLERVAFDSQHDTLWLVGDLINRGPDSLGCLRMARQLKARVVLGNHDLNMLAVSQGVVQPRKGDTLSGILNAPDREEWVEWLRHQPLLIDALIDGIPTVMTHAGLPPQWTLAQARSRAREVERVLQSDDWSAFMSHMYGNTPARFDEALEGWDRLRAITNTLTRMRFITADGTLDFKAKASAHEAPAGLAPWFAYPRKDDLRVIFGHWAALQGHAVGAAMNVIATDSGCVWGNALTAVVLESGQRIDVPSELR